MADDVVADKPRAARDQAVARGDVLWSDHGSTSGPVDTPRPIDPSPRAWGNPRSVKSRMRLWRPP
jgi:hypothetical protein